MTHSQDHSCLVADASTLFIHLVVHFKPRAGTHARELEEGVRPSALPTFQGDTEETLRLPRQSPNLTNGVPRAMGVGALAGVVLGPVDAFVPYFRTFHFYQGVVFGTRDYKWGRSWRAHRNSYRWIHLDIFPVVGIPTNNERRPQP